MEIVAGFSGAIVALVIAIILSATKKSIKRTIILSAALFVVIVIFVFVYITNANMTINQQDNNMPSSSDSISNEPMQHENLTSGTPIQDNITPAPNDIASQITYVDFQNSDVEQRIA